MHYHLRNAPATIPAITPEEMVEILIGSGLEYDNVVFTGTDTARGSFWGGPGTSVGSVDEKNNSIKCQIYPNPAGEVLNIVVPDGHSYDVNLFGQDGRSYFSDQVKYQITIDIRSVPAGIYFLRITSKNWVSTTKIAIN